MTKDLEHKTNSSSEIKKAYAVKTNKPLGYGIKYSIPYTDDKEFAISLLAKHLAQHPLTLHKKAFKTHLIDYFDMDDIGPTDLFFSTHTD